ncbi:MFS transporter [Sporolactobacillus sp. CQH2019]|uniref:MFS transporter n=1 Tax=Sporolactobacillus sp. CQH2019 TaxID=3023512 RepID=UPI00236774D0|nr:MFS transporter [Sporolactobacillus sp. CQH2019]MDD9149079.1 MFS transporter [Sporolactobacillus sp. CQH2019]
MIKLLQNRNFSLLFIGQLISQLGDFGLTIALPFYVYQLSGSPLATALTYVTRALPMFFVGPIAGVFVDRWNLKRTMWIANLSSALVLLPGFYVTSVRWIWLLWLGSLLESSCNRFFNPAKQSFIPQLVRKEELVEANGFSSMIESIAQILGPILAGGLAVWIGFQSILLIDIGSYLISALCIFLLPALLIIKVKLAAVSITLFGWNLRTVWPSW